jgi:ABC-type amino acid transport substrate-binding protein
MTRWRWGVVVALGAVVLLAVALLGRSVLGVRDRTWSRIQETGVWRVGMDPSFPPFENLDVESGKPAGLDVDLAEEIAARWGVRVEFVGVGFDQLMDAVVAQRIDSAVSALPVAMHRTREMRFSDPYIEAGTVLAVPPDSPLILELSGWVQKTDAPLAALGEALAGRRIAVEWGSEGDALARSLQKASPGELQLVLRQSPEEALRAVDDGAADAVIVDAISLALYDGTGKRLLPVGRPLRSDPYAIVVSVDAPELLRSINEALAALQADGTLDQIKARWLGAPAP